LKIQCIYGEGDNSMAGRFAQVICKFQTFWEMLCVHQLFDSWLM